jgi:hypothetical protein
VLCLDGISSMTGNASDLPAFAAMARELDAILYVDDAHGFGIVGERDGYDPTPYGRRGNAIVRRFGESYDQIVLTAGFSKAYSSLLAFVTCSPELKRYLKAMVPPPTSTPARSPSPRWPPPWPASRSTRAAATTYGPCSGSGPGPLLDHLEKRGIATTNTSGPPWSSWPWPTPPTWTPSAATCSTAAST